MWRPGPNGTLYYPRRGSKAPECPEGYEPSEGDPYIAHLKIPVCDYRELRTRTSCCGGSGAYTYCNWKQTPVTRLMCVKCELVRKRIS